MRIDGQFAAHIALEGRPLYAEEKDYPPVINTNARVMIASGSVIINPLGKVLATVVGEGGDIDRHELDLDDVIRGKFVSGHYARLEVLTLFTESLT